MLNFCLCFTDSSGTYHKHPLVACASVFANTQSKVCAHIICDGTVPQETQALFHELAARYSQTIRFHIAPELPGLDRMPAVKRFGKGALFRLLMPELLSDAGLALYMDCDTICNRDIAEIFASAPGNKAIAGVAAKGTLLCPGSRAYIMRKGMEPANYVNSGMLVMNLERIRKKYPNFRSAAFELLSSVDFAYLDQDAINFHFGKHNEIELLPEDCNWCLDWQDASHRELAEYKGKFLHYTGEKPWKGLFPAALIYWQYYAVCFGAENALKEIMKLPMGENFYLYRFILANDKRRRRLRRQQQIGAMGLLATVKTRLFPFFSK